MKNIYNNIKYKEKTNKYFSEILTESLARVFIVWIYTLILLLIPYQKIYFKIEKFLSINSQLTNIGIVLVLLTFAALLADFLIGNILEMIRIIKLTIKEYKKD